MSSNRNIELEMRILQKLQWITHIGSIMKGVTAPVVKISNLGSKPITVLERFLSLRASQSKAPHRGL